MTHPLSLSHWGAFRAVVAGDRVVEALPFERDPAPSAMIHAFVEMVHGPLRIRAPAMRSSVRRHGPGAARDRRGSDPFVEVSWDEALAFVAAEHARVRAERGPGAIMGGSYGWSSAGRFHHARTQLRRFLFTGGGAVDQVGNYSWGAAQTFLPWVIGTHDPVAGKATHWPSIIRHTRLFLAFGGLSARNAQVWSGGGGEHRFDGWIAAARGAGVRFVVVSPSRADLPPGAPADWIAIRPGTDAALMLALGHELIRAGRADRSFLARHTVGFDRLEAHILGRDDGRPKSPVWAEAVTGVPAAVTRALAEDMARAPTLVSTAWSLQRGRFGEQSYWLTIALAAILGGIGRPGEGFAFGHGSGVGTGNPRVAVPAPAFGAGPNPAGLSIPVARIADALERPGEGYRFDGADHVYPDIRLVHWAGGNPFHHHQDLGRLDRAWRRPETVIVQDAWWTATARRADVVLPATTTLERTDVGGSSNDRFVFAMAQAIPPVGLARNDHDMLAELAGRLGHEEAFTGGRSPERWLATIYDRVRSDAAGHGVALPDPDAFRAIGYAELPEPASPFVLFEAFRRDPAAHPLATPSGRIELASDRLAALALADMPGVPTYLPDDEPAEAGDLVLITRQPADRLHAQLDPAPLARASKIDGREALSIHPADAAARGIAEGATVKVSSPRGTLLAGARLDDGLMRGVVALATGAWFAPDADGVDRAGAANTVTRDVGTSELTQGCSGKRTRVRVAGVNGTVLPLSPPTAPIVSALPEKEPGARVDSGRRPVKTGRTPTGGPR